MYESLLEGKESLQQMAICQTAGIESDVKRIILDDVFWEGLTGSLTTLKPMVAAITKIEGDDAILSDVQYLFADLKQQIQLALPSSPLLKAEEKAVEQLMEKRQKFCMRPILAAAYMLDPKYNKGTLSPEEINSTYKVFTALSDHLKLDVGKVLGSLAKYRAKQGLWQGEGIWQSSLHIPASIWWKGLCGSETLASTASVLLQIPPTSAASERNWSLFGNTHTKVHNRLTNERVGQPVAIRANLRLFEPNTKPSSTRLDMEDTKFASLYPVKLWISPSKYDIPWPLTYSPIFPFMVFILYPSFPFTKMDCVSPLFVVRVSVFQF
ncbi:hypothetical protein MHYP_G00256530 [Metynnis hypsauchen]